MQMEFVPTKKIFDPNIKDKDKDKFREATLDEIRDQIPTHLTLSDGRGVEVDEDGVVDVAPKYKPELERHGFRQRVRPSVVIKADAEAGLPVKDAEVMAETPAPLRRVQRQKD